MGRSYGFTHPGHVRKNNEDAYYCGDERGLWIVCDGMGGHQEGNFASHLVTDIFERMQMRGSFDRKLEAIRSQLYNIHLILQKKAQKSGRNAVIGTTVALLFVEGSRGVSVHAGDSRCYLLRDQTLSLVTADHAKEVRTPNGRRKVLTNALSAPGEVSLEIKKFRVEPGDRFLLCSDGVYDKVTNAVIKTALQQPCAEAGLELLASSVLARQADDNLTALIVDAGEA